MHVTAILYSPPLHYFEQKILTPIFTNGKIISAEKQKKEITETKEKAPKPEQQKNTKKAGKQKKEITKTKEKAPKPEQQKNTQKAKKQEKGTTETNTTHEENTFTKTNYVFEIHVNNNTEMYYPKIGVNQYGQSTNKVRLVLEKGIGDTIIATTLYPI